MAESESKENLKINDYFSKLNTLKDAIFEERNKGQKYLQMLKDYEKTLQEKDNDITNLEKEKYQFQNELKVEQSKLKVQDYNVNVLDRVFHKEKFSKEKYDKLLKDNKKLLDSNKDMEHQISDQHELYLQAKAKFQSILTLKSIKFKEVNLIKSDLQKEIAECNKDYQKTTSMQRNIEFERKDYEEKYREYSKKILASEERLNKQKDVLKYSKFKNDELDFQIKKLNDELNVLQKEIKQVASDEYNKNFKIEKFKILIKDKKKFMYLIFNIEKTKLEIILKTNDDEMHIPFRDVTKFEFDPDDFTFTSIIFEYNYGLQKEHKILTFTTHPKITSVVLEVYNKFSNKSSELEAEKK